MRKFLLCLISGLGMAIMTSAAQAAFITFAEDPLETAPVLITTNIVVLSSTAGPESASVTGFHYPGISPEPLSPGIFAAALFEDAAQTMVSDYVVLTVGEQVVDPLLLFRQNLIVKFFSTDILLADLIAQLGAEGVTVTFGGGLVEDGTVQDISFFLGSIPEGLIVSVQSHPEGGVAVPEPASVALLAAGLAGFGFARRRTLAA